VLVSKAQSVQWKS